MGSKEQQYSALGQDQVLSNDIAPIQQVLSDMLHCSGNTTELVRCNWQISNCPADSDLTYQIPWKATPGTQLHSSGWTPTTSIYGLQTLWLSPCL